MISVMIVDDEKWICELIVRAVPWKDMGMEVVRVACNGIEAAEILEKEEIDIVITDIRMPGLDGIGLITRARESGIESKFIIISGYQDFEYAKSAIEYGVTGYIVKPVDEDELMVILYKIADELSEKKNRETHEREMETELEKTSMQIKEQFVRLMIKGDDTDRSVVDSGLRLGFENGKVICVVVRVDGSSGVPDEELVSIILAKMIERVNTALEEAGMRSAYCIESQSAVYLVDSGDDAAVREVFKNCLGDLKVIAGSYRQYSVTVGIGSVQNAGGISLSYADADAAVKYRLIAGKNRVIESAGLVREKQRRALTQLNRRRIRTAAESMDDEQLIKLVDELFAEMGKEKDPALLIALSKELTECFCGVLREAGYETNTDEKTVKRLIEGAGTIDALKETVKSVLTGEMKYFRLVKQAEYSRPVAKVKEYVAEHYAEGISLADAAEHAGLNPNYLSKLFKNETGVTFIDYLTEVRIDAAKGLLREHGAKTSSVPEKIGYADAKHFAKTFKRLVGITPSEYRRIYE